MLRFISHLQMQCNPPSLFQYIPCYGLSVDSCTGSGAASGISIHPMLRFILSGSYSNFGSLANFNTSHVTVYHHRSGQRCDRCGFQYIPCYGLSRAVWICKAADSISIHPMLRFISLRFLHFSKYTSISIHPMLRFIINVHRKRIVYALFQYIPCYGLSPFLVCHATNKTKFQYIPCYGLSPDGKLQKGVLLTISIHPMLRFIFLRRINKVRVHDFNTSHVTVYLIKTR